MSGRLHSEMTPNKDKKRLEELPWTLFVDGSSSRTRYRAGILLEFPHGILLEQALTIAFLLTNNQKKFEVCLTGLEIVTNIEVQVLKVSNEPNLLLNQLNGEYQVKEPILQKYIKKLG